MKTHLKLLAGLIFALSISNVSAFAQGGKFGQTPEDSIACRRNLSTLKFGVEAGEMDGLIDAWRTLSNVCPSASGNIYIWGVQVLEYEIGKQNDPAVKDKYVDTLLMSYDNRLVYFPRNFKDYDVAYRKIIALNNFAPERHEQIKAEIDSYISLAFKNAEVKTSSTDNGNTITYNASAKQEMDFSMIPQAFQQVKFMYEKKQKTADELLSSYDEYAALLDRILAVNPGSEDVKTAKGLVDGLLISIPELSSCENLIAIYTPKFEANPTDASLLKQIVYMLENRKCQDSQLFSDAVEALYKVEPNAQSALALVTLFALKGDYQKAVEYLNSAIAGTEDATEKSKLEVRLAALYLQELNQTSQAISHARAAIALDSKNGSAHVIIGTAYAKLAAGARSCGDFESKAVFWAVVDAFNRAKQADPSLANDVNKSINQYSQYFPSKEDVFMNGYSEGAAYTVSCNGINERTTVRGK